jgi:hypothetical protein
MNVTRRRFLGTAVAAVAVSPNILPAKESKKKSTNENPLDRQVGITTSSLSAHFAARSGNGKFTLLELPKIMREELDMRVIDLNTSSFVSYDPAYLDKFRKAADDAGCILTNLKLNQRGLDMNSADKAVREKALTEYKRSIDAAGRLGLKWARPLPLPERPDMKRHVAAYRELADYAAERKVRMLVENYAWMESDPESVVKLIKAVGRNLAASPDTGNWKNNDLRYEGLKKTFPLAVTCDFKARQLGPHGEHKLYDLKRCFEIGWESGFRGPWCLEHANADRKTLFKELAMLRDMLRKWMAEQS